MSIENLQQEDILLEWDDLDNARKYYQSDKFREATKDAGVLGIPDIYYLKNVEKGSD